MALNYVAWAGCTIKHIANALKIKIFTIEPRKTD